MSNPATNWEDAYRVQTARIAELERENAELRAHAERVGEANDRLVVEHDALRATLDIIIAADERAVKLWRAAHPGNELVIPDRGRLVGWLLEQNDALRADKARLDWLTNSLGWIVVGNVNEADPSQHAKEGDTLAGAWRAAIDAARRGAQP